MKQGWEIKQLGEVCNLTGGGTPSKKIEEYYDGNILWATIRDMNEDILYATEHKITQIGLDNSSSNIIPKDNVIIATRVGLGKVCFLLNDTAINQDLKGIIPKNEDEIFNMFLFWWFKNISEQIVKAGTGATVQGVKISFIQSLQFPLPPLDEQKRIVAKLDECFDAIDKARANVEKNLNNAKELFQSQLNQIFSQPALSEAEGKGNGWADKRIEEMTENVSKGSSPKWQGINYVENDGILFITSENVGEAELLLHKKKYVEKKFNDKEKKSILKKGDVLTNIVGASIGRTAIYDIDDIANINQAVCVIRCNENVLNNYYLMYLLNSPFFKTILHENEVNNARANLSLTFFRNLIIPIPNTTEQQSIVEFIIDLKSQTQSLESNYQQELAALDELKKSILQKAFMGKL
jgi:type I restriction enzyme S subunit